MLPILPSKLQSTGRCSCSRRTCGSSRVLRPWANTPGRSRHPNWKTCSARLPRTLQLHYRNRMAQCGLGCISVIVWVIHAKKFQTSSGRLAARAPARARRRTHNFMQRPPYHDSNDFRRHFQFKACLILNRCHLEQGVPTRCEKIC